MDEKYRNGKDETGKTVGGGWQSGLLTAGGVNVSTPKEAYSQAAPDFAAGRSACTGAPVSWSPTTVVPLVKQAKPKTRRVLDVPSEEHRAEAKFQSGGRVRLDLGVGGFRVVLPEDGGVPRPVADARDHV